MTIQYWSIILRDKLGWSALRFLLIDSSKQNFKHKVLQNSVLVKNE